MRIGLRICHRIFDRERGGDADPHRLRTTLCPVPVTEITIDEFAPEWESGAVVIDVRMPDEFAEVRVPGARLIPLPDLPDRLDEIPSEGDLYIICRSGARSARAAEFL